MPCRVALPRQVGPRITDAGLVHLAGLSGLEALRLDYSTVTGAGLAHLRNLTLLRYLGLRRCPVTDDAISHITALPSLRNLDVSDTEITPSGLKTLKEALPECRISSNLNIKQN